MEFHRQIVVFLFPLVFFFLLSRDPFVTPTLLYITIIIVLDVDDVLHDLFSGLVAYLCCATVVFSHAVVVPLKMILTTGFQI
jgi:hypothetical protein